MKSKFRSVQFKSVLMIVLGAALILLQLLVAAIWSWSNQKPDYETGLLGLFDFIGTWIYLIVGILSLGFGIFAAIKHRLIRGTSVVLTLALGTAALVVTTLSSAVMSRSLGLAQLAYYETFAIDPGYLLVILALFTGGPVSMSVVALAFPYTLFAGSIYKFLNPDMQEYWSLYIFYMVRSFVIPCVWSIIIERIARGGGWKRLLAGFAVGYCDLVALRALFGMLRTPFMPSSFGEAADTGLAIILLVCGVAVTAVALWLFSRYDKKHPRQEISANEAVSSGNGVYGVPPPPQAPESQIRICRKCGAQLPQDSAICSCCKTKTADVPEGTDAE